MMTDFVAEILVRKYKRKQPLEAAGVSIRFHPRKRVFFRILKARKEDKKKEKGERDREKEREFPLSGLDTHHLMWCWCHSQLLKVGWTHILSI
jgi:hypothetical protein